VTLEDGALPVRFFGHSDILALELEDLDYPWDHAAIEDRIREYERCSEAINSRLTDGVRRNYGEFVQGIKQVEDVEMELTQIGVLLKNSRRKLKDRDNGLVRGSMQVARQKRKSDRMGKLLATLLDFQTVVRTDARLKECLRADNYCDAIVQHAKLRDELAGDRFRHFPGLVGLREGLGLHLAVVQQKLSDGLRVAAVSSDFDAGRYEDILKAYSMMSADQALSVGKELLRHMLECIVAVSRQCMLAFSMTPPHESPARWHQKAQLRDLCRSMDPTRFVACTVQLYEHLNDFLYRHDVLCSWHVSRLQEVEADGAAGHNPRFREVLREVLSELTASKRNVWDRIQQQVSLVLMTSDFQYPRLNEDGFLHILRLTQLLIDEGDHFMADFQPPREGVSSTEGRRAFSAPIRNTLKSKAHDYFQSLHYHAWVSFKLAYIEQDGWQRLPVPRNHRLLRLERLQTALPPRGSANTGESRRTAENNPFRSYKVEPLLAQSIADMPDSDGLGGRGGGARQAPDEIDEHALLQHWIDDNEDFSLEQIGSSMLSNSNSSPVVSSSTVELARLLERYIRMMGAIPQLALEVFQAAVQLIEFYVHSMLCLFVPERHLRALLEDLDTPLAPGDPRAYQRHEALLVQSLCPELRRTILRTRELVSSVTLPDSCAANLCLPAPVSAAVLLQVDPFEKLTSPSTLCGLPERCVGAESIIALLADLRDIQQWLATLLPRGVAQEALERFLPTLEVTASQLRTYVLSCAARDILEFPDVGRVSLEHFSSTVQGLRWDAKDFSQGSPASPYLEQLRAQLEELARRLPCAGGGSIPYATQRCVWGWMEVRIMHECTELVAKLGRRKSQEALFCLAEDFQSIRSMVTQSFQGQGGREDEVPLLPPDHPMASTVVWSYLDQYLEAHGGLQGDALMSWCRRHPGYPMRLHRALIEYLHGGNQKIFRQLLGDLEAFYTGYIADEVPGTPSLPRDF